MTQPEQLQLPQHGIESIDNSSRKLLLPESSLPWVSEIKPLHVAEITLETGDSVGYCSAISLHNGITKIARKVPDQQSTSAEAGLFKSLPVLLADSNNLPPNIDTVPSYTGVESDGMIYKVAKQGRNAARLYFMITNDRKGAPVVVKLGIASHDKQVELQSLFSGKKRPSGKHDGASR